MIKTAIRFQSNMVMVFDEKGEQIPQYQERYKEVRGRILEDAPANAVFAHGFTVDGELRTIPREAW